ncbi:MAG: PadR family transcriptional regulator [Coriobacteriia bacterium]|nr:PadR family transcriptional regulator [Coriobacteriia bacterium]
MALEHAILGFLEREPMTGYDLKTRCFDAAVGHVWTADQAQVYRTLDRLAARGLVKPKLVPQRGKPDRRVFTITRSGRAALGDWLRRPEDPGPLRDPLLLQLALSAGLPDGEIRVLLTGARDTYMRRLESLRRESIRETPACAAPTPRDAALHRMTLGAAMAGVRSSIDWIDDCLDDMRGGLPPAAEVAADDTRGTP